MEIRDMKEAFNAREALRHRLDRLVETQRWVHHVADLGSGKVLTTALKRPVAPLSRAERLSRLGRHLDTSIFDGPSYELTPRRPYQAQPEAWLIASVPGDYSSLSGLILWQLPRDPSPEPLFQQLECYFSVSLDRQSLLSIALSGQPWSGKTGSVRMGVWGSSADIQIPITGSFAAHTVDLIFDPVPGQPTDFFMVPRGAIQLLFFRAISLRVLPPMLEPDPP